MLVKRIIPCLDIKDGQTVKGIEFESLCNVGDPVELGKYYSNNGADELVFLDITATHEKRKTLIELVKRIAKEINIPFTVGGGISSIEDAEAILSAGADKISINSSAINNDNESPCAGSPLFGKEVIFEKLCANDTVVFENSLASCFSHEGKCS